MTRSRTALIKVAAAVLAIGAIVVPITLANAAPEKVFDLKLAPASVPTGATGVTMTATFRNATPSGVSAISSVKLFANAPAGFRITSATGVGNEVVAPDGRSVSVSSIPPVKPGRTYVLTLKVNTPAGSNCAGSTVTWSGNAWTGSPFTGSTFRFLPESSVVTTALTACELRFVEGREPADASTGATIASASGAPVQVALFEGSSPAPSFDGEISLSIGSGSTGSGTLSGGTANAVDGTATFGSLSIDQAGEYQLVASGGGLESDPSPTFTISHDAVLECGDDFSESGAAGDLTIIRQQGACSVPIPISIVVGDNEFDVNKPKVVGSAFRMTIGWVVETPDNPVPATEIDYGDSFGPHAMQWCLADGPDGDNFPELPPRNDGASGDEFWCVTGQDIELFESGPNAGLLQLVEDYFGGGDPKFTRR